MPTTIMANKLVYATLAPASLRGAIAWSRSPDHSLCHSLSDGVLTAVAAFTSAAALMGTQQLIALGPFGCKLMAVFYGRFSQPLLAVPANGYWGCPRRAPPPPPPPLPGARLSPILEPQVADFSLPSH